MAIERKDELAQLRPWHEDRLGIADSEGNMVTLFCHWNIPLIIDSVNQLPEAIARICALEIRNGILEQDNRILEKRIMEAIERGKT